MDSGTERWDAIVIGSGLGGLTAAAYLQTNGMRTIVLEQYDVAGGSSHVFRRKREWEFDVGLHHIGDCQPGGSIPGILSPPTAALVAEKENFGTSRRARWFGT